MTELVEVGPKTKDVAVGLLAAAKKAGLSADVVQTYRNGFLVPQKVADAFNAPQVTDEAKEPAPKPVTEAKVTTKAKTKKEGTGNDD